MRFSDEVHQALTRAGWFPGRQVAVDLSGAGLSGFAWHQAARFFLSEFAGISVEVKGSGVSVAREPFLFDPEAAVGEEDRFEAASERFARHFCPVGEIGRGEFFLAIDENAVMYLLAHEVFRLGPVDEALANLVLGVKATRVPRA
ncbi:SUKH-3 domain-containing protein [Streptomyces sp. NPDC021020]|uniref:SUKH-3 domain-containing protein n=1 Tax=Streptomyces sp. NPDC021020 TaxID=3365109 RepID=UPI0037AD57F5